MQSLRKTDRRIDWVNAIFLSTTQLIALTIAPLYIYTYGISWPVFAVFAFYVVATPLSITAGYHRLFAHRTYRASTTAKLFYLLFGGAAFEGSGLQWASDHRNHHAYTDQDKDPYSIKKGFLYAHIGWLYYKDRGDFSTDNIRDLARDPLLHWQHRYYALIATTVGLVLPLVIGYALGDPWGCLLLAGVVRIVIVYHSTFFVNSLAHFGGPRPYSLKDSARDNAYVAFLTYGEGYHNFHHQFPYDYRNGIRWYQWDPTKWLIKFIAIMGLADQLRKASEEQIFQVRAQVQKELVQQRLDQHPVEARQGVEEKLHAAYDTLIAARARWELLKTEYQAVKQSMDQVRREMIVKLEQELRMAREHFLAAHRSWSILVRGLLRAPA